MKNFINKLVFFIGWILSPFTFWNDAFVNIPIAYITASLLFGIIHVKFIVMVVVCYWLSNIAGIAMMYLSGKAIVRTGRDKKKELVSLLATIAIYSACLVLLAKTGILKPVTFLRRF